MAHQGTHSRFISFAIKFKLPAQRALRLKFRSPSTLDLPVCSSHEQPTSHMSAALLGAAPVYVIILRHDMRHSKQRHMFARCMCSMTCSS